MIAGGAVSCEVASGQTGGWCELTSTSQMPALNVMIGVMDIFAVGTIATNRRMGDRNLCVTIGRSEGKGSSKPFFFSFSLCQ